LLSAYTLPFTQFHDFLFCQSSSSSKRSEPKVFGGDRFAEKVSAPQICGIHRDFYPDQVLIDGSRIYLLDLDLYTNGDPGLDVGNFNGHLIEHSMRLLGHPNALLQQQTALIDRFVALSGEAGRSSIEVYTSLTLVRHIYLSTQFPARRSFTEPILEYCEHILHHLI
jgi:aminoglycoside phosphotransferase (APT) family kinase protein